VEIWNELTFGSDFLDINHYYDPPLIAAGPEFLHAGGAAWELGRRTVVKVKELDPAARVIWGFSNTTFFHTAVVDLPSGVDAQSYHPYGTGPRCYARLAEGKERYNVGGFVPDGCATMPEGWAQSFQQTETLMRVLNPEARAAHPPAVLEFKHFMTEHGFEPLDLGIADSAVALRAKQKFVLRAAIFWLNKGISGLYYYNSYDPNELSFGVLRADGSVSPAMETLHRTVARFAGSVAISRARKIDASVTREAGPAPVYANDPLAKQVQQQQTAAVLPFQIDEHKFVVALYVMTEDFPRDLPPQQYRITIDGMNARGATVAYYDPMSDTAQPVQAHASDSGRLQVTVALTDVPRLLEVSER
jgi:hypothetical protein